jgi:F0F1-type ATP synthase epsilon subunit
MHLRIISPLRTQTYEVVWVELNTNVGNFVIQSGHAPMLLILEQGKELTFRLKNGKEESLLTSKGVAEITREMTTVIIDEHQ